ncbi:FG-GAP repeat domain-containing protein [Streptomyces sp. NPDC101132]|uniref:FG-GAP repeat domain-containing protein n=1 Tax=Streptomyces sp. NPDC101132 TaxID=3366110 RepID=UPI00382186AB
MHQSASRRTRHLTTLAVAAALVATAGPAALPAAAAAPAHGVPAGASTDGPVAGAPAGVSPVAGAEESSPGVRATVPSPGVERAAAVPRIPRGSEVLAGGPSGILTWQRDGDGSLTWTRSADGVGTRLGRDGTGVGEPDCNCHGLHDTIALTDTEAPSVADKVTVRRMATGAESSVRLRARGLRYLGALGSTVIAFRDEPGRTEVHLLDLNGTRVTDRVLPGVPARSYRLRLAALAPGTFVLRYQTGPEVWDPVRDAVVDAKAGRVRRTHASGGWGEPSLSATHVAWSGTLRSPETGTWHNVVRVAAIGSADVTVRLTSATADDWARSDLMGDWLLTGPRTQLGLGSAGTDHGLYATPLAGGPRTPLLDHVTSVVPGPAGTAFAAGGTTARGEGVYRIAPGADGKPAATLVGGTGEPTRLTLRDSAVPPVVRLDGTAGSRMRWQLSRYNARVRVVLRHTATGATLTADTATSDPSDGRQDAAEIRPDQDAWFQLDWQGVLEDTGGHAYRQAPNGAYTYALTAQPQNGIGPDLEVTGSFTVRRAAVPHDLTDDGTPDLLARTRGGLLAGVNSLYWKTLDRTATDHRHGDFWEKYPVLAMGGDVVGNRAADLLARDAAGVLWVYPGKGDGSFASRVRIGSGWGGYDRLAGGTDHDGDRRADLLARDRSGVLWLYRGTGSASAPYKARKRIGSGWNAYDRLVSAGQLGGGASGDLLARDRDGVLWLYLGRGDGTFAQRVRVGDGWGAYRDLVGWGDADRDGRADLYARDGNGRSYVYRGTGDWRAPFAPRAGLPGWLEERNYTEVL